MTANAEAQALVKRLHEAFNDSGFLGMGGTDEEQVLAALKEARDKGLMREVDALYRQSHPDEPGLREELDDELSGDDFDTAMRYYEEGMQAPPKGTQAGGAAGSKGAGAGKGPANPVHATLAPMAESFRVCLLDFGMLPLPGAKCRLADFPNKIHQADGQGMVTLPVPAGRKTLDIEWTANGAEKAEVPFFAFQQTVHVEFAGDDDTAISKQLSNLGFEGESVREQLEAFQHFLGGAKEARPELANWIENRISPFSGAGSTRVA